jgi:hypothetical protein
MATATPWSSSLKGPKSTFTKGNKIPVAKRRHVVQRRTPLDGQMGGTQTETITYETPRGSTAKPPSGARRDFRKFSPTRVADKSTGSVGALEAEFLVCLGLLVLLMFANSTSSYGEKVMSVMKRGTLVCLLFFLLAIISAAGPNAERIAKGFGGLIVVAILITTPFNTALTDIDNLIKTDWIGTSETGGDTAASADAGTQASANNQAESAAISAAENAGLPGQLAALLPTSILEQIGAGASKGTDWVKNFLKGFSI